MQQDHVAHANAPLTPEGRRRLCERVDSGRPIAHVAAEAGISRSCLGKWYSRWQRLGEAGLTDRSSRPLVSPNASSELITTLVVATRRTEKWGPARIAASLERSSGIHVAPATVHRILVREGLSRVRDMDRPTGETMRAVNRYEHSAAGDMLHVDIKKLGKIPDGGGWRVHGQGSDAHRASKRKANTRPGYTYLHSALDDHSRLAYTEALENEQAITAVEFWHRAVAWFAEHGVVEIRSCLTDNGSCYRSHAWRDALGETGTKHRRTQPYTPRTNGKVERFNGTLAREWAYVRPYESEEDRTAALLDFLRYYNYERPHSALSQKPPVTRVPVQPSNLVVPSDWESEWIVVP